MATSQVRNLRQIIIGGSAAITTTDMPDTLNEGEIGIFDERGNRLTESSAASATKFVVALGRGTGEGPLLSDVIDVADVKSMSLKTHVARSHQVSTIGYDGSTSGTSLNVIASNLYFARIYIQELIRSNSDGRRIKQGVFKSTTSSTQSDISLGLTKNFVENFLKEPEQFIAFKSLCSSAVTAANDFVYKIF